MTLKDSQPYRRLRRTWWALLERQPVLYCAYQRRRQPDAPVVDARTDIVIEGRPGCGNSFAREAMLLANPGINVASHVHSAAQILQGIRLGKPVVVIIRSPVDAITSKAARYDNVDMWEELASFARFYERLLPLTDELAVATFQRVTSRFGDVVADVNSRFGASFEPFPHDDPDASERVFATLVAFNRSQGIAEGRAAVPGQARDERVARAQSMLDDPRLSELRRRCEEVYGRFAEVERSRGLSSQAARSRQSAGH